MFRAQALIRVWVSFAEHNWVHSDERRSDITQIDGIGPYTALQLIAEIGTDMTRWRTHKHFTA